MSIRREREAECCSWKNEVEHSFQSFVFNEIDRRTFLKRLSTLAAGTALLPAVVNATGVANAETSQKEEPWLTLSEVQEHLFPSSKDAPGAKEINASGYVQRLLGDPFIAEEETTFLIKGVGWLNDIANKQYQTRFVELNFEQREQALRKIEKSNAGKRWISLVMYYIIEALLSDPVYGGNPEGRGWAWLEHVPGFPRPPKDKVYYKL